jgi:hypothetical protein
MVTMKANRAMSLDMKVLAIAVCLILLVSFVAPISTVDARNPAAMNVIQYRYFATQDQLFNALLTPDSAGGVDVMNWPLTKAEYQTAISNPNIVVEPLSEAGEFELAFNNNWTDGILLDRRSPMNFTDFRNAMNCLVDKFGVINGPVLGGFATRADTQIPQPLMSAFVSSAVSYPNYPWEFNVTHALEILWNGNWYNHAYYPTLVDLIETFSNGTLATYNGTVYGAVYSGNDTNGQWGGNDANAAFNSALANTPLQPLIGYYRTSDGRKDICDFFCNELQEIGCPYNKRLLTHFLPGFNPVTDRRTYDFAPLGYSMGAPPNWFYSALTPIGIYQGGPNCYLVDDGNMTYWATQMYNAPNQVLYQIASNNVQDILVMESELVSVYSPATYCAYKTSMLGQIDVLGQGSMANGAMSENWITLDTRKTNTIIYTGPPSGTPDSNIIYTGLYNPPDMVNPIFQDTVFDFQVSDEIFTYPLASNPNNDIVPGSAITGYPSGSDLPWMAYSWKTELINDPTNSSNPQWTNVTLWFRHDVTWHDGVPFTVADINYTIYESALYGDSWNNYNAVLCVNASNGYAPYFTQWDSWTCSILVSNPSWLSLYTPFYETIPEHLYKYIVANNLTVAEQGWSTDGLHGLWPGQAAVSSNVLPGAPFTLLQLQNNPETTLVGTGPWKYRVGSTSASQFTPGGGITLDVYDGFFLKPALGEMDFRYTWNNVLPSQQPSSGYYKVGLADLVYLANAYGTTGTPAGSVPITEVPGAPHSWNPAADLAPPSGVVGLSDLVTLALHYGWYYGNYSYNAPYPASEIADDGP